MNTNMLFPEFETAILISIKKEHVEKIFSGEKKYELRKILPNLNYGVIYFYQTEGVGIVGKAKVVQVIEGSPSMLWGIVGTKSTTKERFNTYFENRTKGYAIEIEDPIKFDKPIPSKYLKNFISDFVVPQSYLIIRHNHPLHRLLETQAVDSNIRNVTLRAPSKAEIEEFLSLVEVEISPRYPDTGAEFAAFIANMHKNQCDDNGFLTQKKEIVSAINQNGDLIGFSVLTFKRGRSTKTGPTMLFAKFRGDGYGPLLRSALEDRIIENGSSKVYCTCPSEDKAILFHLLKCGYRIEGHLEKQYSNNSNELIFAKEISDSPMRPLGTKRSTSTPGKIYCGPLSKRITPKRLSDLLKYSGIEIQTTISSTLLKSSNSDHIDYGKKSRDIFLLTSESKATGVCILAYKRGGSVRGVLGVETAHSPSIDKMISTSIEIAVKNNRRKLYFLHPLCDYVVLQSFERHGFAVEGILRGAYQFGNDLIIASKLLTQ